MKHSSPPSQTQPSLGVPRRTSPVSSQAELDPESLPQQKGALGPDYVEDKGERRGEGGASKGDLKTTWGPKT